ncbi:hypothetical protein [Tahibacter amnicola]|uniref:Uncharacterized protein n=1 Tax=Tahibacter amnicola TaxID=2976241 RepID=A0ABY6BI85_9GAMM|nr:hypothetical protein [Tahibacter amnicola]UXI69301.1 hypothetical protein N4264_06540 [Tahibacter amnicola]
MVLLFWESEQKWTVLGTQVLASCHDSVVEICELDVIGRDICLLHPPEHDARSAKTTAEYLRLSRPGICVWAPSGAELFALWNILLQFPLAVSEA